MKPLIVSPAPHAHSGDSVTRNMLLVILALMPAFAVSICSFGWSTIITTVISIAACVLTEWVISKFVLKTKPTLLDCSAILTGLLLAFNLPANLPWWIVIIGAIVAIGVGKMSFGGLGQNPFNPALVGRVFLLISFPVQMTTWPRPLGFATRYVDALTGATPLAAMKTAIKSHSADALQQLPDLWQMFIGYMGGSMGEMCAFALIIGGILLIITRVITWHIPVSILATVAVFAAISSWTGLVPEGMDTCHYMATTLLSGGLMLGAFFMATDYVTSPMTGLGKIIFGIGIGIITMVIRTWGAYPEGVSFAILIMNATVPLLNKLRPKRFGTTKA